MTINAARILFPINKRKIDPLAVYSDLLKQKPSELENILLLHSESVIQTNIGILICYVIHYRCKICKKSANHRCLNYFRKKYKHLNCHFKKLNNIGFSD